MMLDSSEAAHNMLDDLLSYHGNMMLAGVVSLLLVILFTLLLHIFGRRCLLTRLANNPNDQNNTTTAYLHHSTRKGLDIIIASIPVFVYEAEKRSNLMNEVEECAICLSDLKDGDMGRRLQSCGHSFHVECIDMWLCSHLSCPICRSLVIIEEDDGDKINYLSQSHDAGGSAVVGSGSDSAAGSDLV